MRNLKKILALVLAMIMVVSMMVTASATNFADDASIDSKHAVAVEVMAALGILKGNPTADGSFNFDPTGTLTREQAAKIIAYVHAGSDKAVTDLAKDFEHPFTDVPAGHWSEDYIAYCYNLGLTNGVSATAYGSKQILTGLQLAKMMLVAAGFRANEDFTAAAWQTETRVALKELSLTGNLSDITWSAPISREHAAQLVWNVMNKAPSITKTQYVVTGISNEYLNWDGEDYDTEDGVATKFSAISSKKYDSMAKAIAAGVSVKKSDSANGVYNTDFVVEEVTTTTTDTTKTMFAKKFSLKTHSGVVTANQATKLQGYSTIGGKKFNIETGLDLIGHNVTVYYKSEWSSNTSKGTAYAVVDNAKVITVAEDQEGLTEKEVESLLKIEDASTSAINTIVNYAPVGTDTVVTVNADDATKYDVAAGTYIVNDADDGVAYYKYEYSYLDTLTVTITDEDKGYYTVADSARTIVNVVEDKDSCYNLVKTDIDWLALVEENEGDTTYTYTVNYEGDFRYLSAVNSVVGTITKVGEIAGLDAIYVGGYPCIVHPVAAAAYAAQIADLDLEAIADLVATPDFATEYRFFLDGSGFVVGYELADKDALAPSDANLIVPVALYHKAVKVTEEGDAYTDGTEDTIYTYWIQGVTMDGKEVNLQVSWAEFQTFLKAGASSVAGYDAEGKPVADSASGKQVDGDKLGVLYTYTTQYNLTADADLADLENDAADFAANSAHSTGASYITAADKKVTLDKNYYLNDTFKVIVINGSKTNLSVSVMGANVGVIESTDILYGEKAEGVIGDNYDLKYVIIYGRELTVADPEQLIYVKNADASTTKVPHDVNGDGKIAANELAYEHTVYVNGVKTTILTQYANGKTGETGATLAANTFFSYSIKNGMYILSNYAGSDVKEAVDVTGNYKGLISVSGLADFDVSNAKLVNLTGNKKLVTDPAKLTNEYTISFIYDETGASLIYIVDYVGLTDTSVKADKTKVSAVVAGASSEVVYSVVVDNTAHTIKINVSGIGAADVGDTVTIAAGALKWAREGENTQIVLTKTAEAWGGTVTSTALDGTTTQEYTITVVYTEVEGE